MVGGGALDLCVVGEAIDEVSSIEGGGGVGEAQD